MSRATVDRGSVGSATLWMIGLSILLFWIPTVGPLIAGFVGGRKAGGDRGGHRGCHNPRHPRRRLAISCSGAIVELPIIGALVGAGLFFVILFESVPLLIGALVGGAQAE